MVKFEKSIEVGDVVKHPKWGEGTVLYKTGSGDLTKVIVVFPDEGQKKLLVKHARLKKIKGRKEKGKVER